MELNSKNYLYAIGCSHMAGSEIAGDGITAPLKTNTNNAWPGQIAEQQNLNYINHSVPGGSNEFIMRSCIDFVTKWIASGRQPEELFVVVGWTTNERLEFEWEGERYHWCNGTDPSFFQKADGKPDFTNWFKYLQLYHTEYDFGLFKKITYMIALNSFLKSVNVDHVQVNNCASIPKDSWKALDMQHLEHSFPNDVFYNKHESFIEKYNTDENKEHFTPWLHADKHIHTLYANEIIKFIEEN